uniref:LolD lipoprotein releasing system, ATP-binding protein n=1 Tax=uncultured bacterium CSLF43 TaxID=1091575 RepID=G4WW10_9BACT|nr:LolD lipoprotein releasing system, ATP-binding protein [uncultured bacterium CSLF43]
MPDSDLSVARVSVGYGADGLRVQALRGVSLVFAKGELTLIMGPSGSGKTTLLSLLGCLMKPDEGAVSVHGADAASLDEAGRTLLRRRHIGFIFQAFRLFHALPAFENVMIAADLDEPGRTPERIAAARDLLQRLGLNGKLHLKPKELSGGEKQRVAIARALLPKPSILLADEPTASLDSAAGRQICGILRELAEKDGRTIVVVSHDPRWNEFAHRTVVLHDGCVIGDRSNIQ